MNIATRARVLVGAAALTGAVIATGSAFTATGIGMSAPASQFLGGTVAQSVTGATLSTVVYGFEDASNTSVNSITLTFSDSNANGAAVTLTPSGGSGTFSCANVTAGSSTCSIVGPATGYSGLSGVSITVGNTSA